MVKTTKSTPETLSPAKQVAGFIAKFDPAIAKLTRSCRSVIRKRYPSAIELVYDNYNALAIGYSPTEKTSDAVFSLAVYPRGLDLYFVYGRSLPDPNGLLLGSGTQGAFIRLESAATLDEPKVIDLIQRAVKRQRPTFPAKGKGYTVVKSISAKQRPRRPK
jgi:Domain of unknown function (DU1801).